MSDPSRDISSTAGARLLAEREKRAAKAPGWLRDVLVLIAQDADKIEPIKDDRTQLPEFIYRH